MSMPSEYGQILLRYGTTENPKQENVLWYQPDAVIGVGNGAAAASNLAGLADAQLGPLILDVIAPDANYYACVVNLNIAGVTFTATSAASSSNGNRTGTTSPENVAVVIRKVTDTGGKSGRGRWFIACVPEDFTDIGIVNPTATVYYQSLADGMRHIYAGTYCNFGPRHHSRITNDLVPIRDCIATRGTRSQRRRLVRP